MSPPPVPADSCRSSPSSAARARRTSPASPCRTAPTRWRGWLLSFAIGAPATNALNLTLSPSQGTQIVGAPQLTLTYSGVGTSRHVYAQIVDEQTGVVLGGIVTPIPVTLDGQTHTVTVPLEAIAYTAPPGAKLTLQVVSSATPYLNLLSFGGDQHLQHGSRAANRRTQCERNA